MSNSSSRRTARHTAPAESAAPAVGRRSTARLGALTVEVFTADKLPAAARPATAVITPSGAVAFYVLPDADAPAAPAAPAEITESAPAEAAAPAAPKAAKPRVRVGVAAKKPRKPAPAEPENAALAAAVAEVAAAPAKPPVDVLASRIRKMDAEHKALLHAIYKNDGVVPDGTALPRALMMPKGNDKPRTTRMITPDGKRMTDECMTAFARVLEARK